MLSDVSTLSAYRSATRWCISTKPSRLTTTAESTRVAVITRSCSDLRQRSVIRRSRLGGPAGSIERVSSPERGLASQPR